MDTTAVALSTTVLITFGRFAEGGSMVLINMEIEKADPIMCSGYKSIDNCHNKGKYDSKSISCKECTEDAIKAMDIDIILTHPKDL